MCERSQRYLQETSRGTFQESRPSEKEIKKKLLK